MTYSPEDEDRRTMLAESSSLSRSKPLSPTLVQRLRAESKASNDQMADLPGVVAGGIRYLAALCAEAADAIEAAKPSETALPDADAERFRFLVDDPETARHLLSLLQQKKGNEDSLRKMIDRITESKIAANRHTGEQ